MKYFLLLILVSATAYTQNMSIYRHDVEDGIPLIKKVSGTGFTRVEYRRSEECSVYVNKLVIKRTVGKVTLTEYKDIFVERSIVAVAEAAMKEEAKKTPNNLCDGPGTSVSVLGDTLNGIVYSTGGCGSPKIEKSDTNSKTILDIINRYCPKTY